MFCEVVNLYRLLGRPDLGQSNIFNKSIDYSPEIAQSLSLCAGFDSEFGVFYSTETDGLIHVEAEFPQNGDYQVFSTVEEFVEKTSSLGNGEFRENFYISEIDYSSEDDVEAPVEVYNLYNISAFIKDLREFSSITLDGDNKIDAGSLIFLKAADGKNVQQAAVLKINIKSSFASLNIQRFEILSQLIKGRESNRPHIEERILMMNSAIAELITECVHDDDDFEYLINNWGKVRKKYFNDLRAYMNGFSFDSIRKKISDSVMDSTTKINTAISDLGTKLLGVPVALGALIALNDAKGGFYSFWLGVIGVVSGAVIIYRTVVHYEFQLANLIKTFQFNVEISSNARKSFSRSIIRELDRIDQELKNQEMRVKKTLAFYKSFSLLPFIFCILMILYRNIDLFKGNEEFIAYLMIFGMLFYSSRESS